MGVYSSCTGGHDTLKPKRRGRLAGTGGRLTTGQAARFRRLVVGNMPDQLRSPLPVVAHGGCTADSLRIPHPGFFGAVVFFSRVGA